MIVTFWHRVINHALSRIANPKEALPIETNPQVIVKTEETVDRTVNIRSQRNLISTDVRSIYGTANRSSCGIDFWGDNTPEHLL